MTRKKYMSQKRLRVSARVSQAKLFVHDIVKERGKNYVMEMFCLRLHL